MSSFREDTAALLAEGFAAVAAWEARWPDTPLDPTLAVDPARMRAVIAELTARLTDNYPFHAPEYAGQMLKPPHPVAAIAYAIAQRINPNNHALDGGPATAHMEKEAVAALARMVGYDPAAMLGHLTSSGTTANLEALWVARELHPTRGIAYSAEAHYTHGRMAEVLGMPATKIAAGRDGRMDLAALDAALAGGGIGTIVATLGTTSLGAVDPLPAILDLATAHGARVHVDAAYGGFFTLLATLPPDHPAALPPATAAAYQAIGHADSIVIDPHKHGLQPYGCGSVLFRDPTVGRFYQHDSPYTYFTSDELHLGEISLECSRAGASAAAFWATLQCFPLERDAGLGPVLQQTRRAAVAWAALMQASDTLRPIMDPALDIVVYLPLPAGDDRRVSRISALADAVFAAGMHEGADAFFLAKTTVQPDRLAAHTDLVWDRPTVTALRSVLMKPEHLAFVPELHARVDRAVRAARAAASPE
jgi:glutamate/tyrosine decarboxylase-like PLP-dependent enzyme